MAGGSESLIIKIGADVSDLESGVGKAHSAIGGLVGGLGAVGLAGMGFNVIKDGLGAVIGPAAEFGAKMSEIKAVSGATGPELAKLHDLALQLGAANDVGSVSASDAADAISVLSKAGVSAQDQMDGMTKSVLQLSAAAGPEFGVAKSAELASDAMATFGLKAKDSSKVVNTLVGAANASTIGLEDMKYSLSSVGTVAATVGMSFTDTATAIAVFGANGLKGSDAGTSLKSMLMHLQPTTKAQSAAMNELGLTTVEGGNAFFDANGKMKSLADVAGTLQDALGGMTEQQKVSYMQTIFGSDAIRAASILTKEGAAGINEMSAAMVKQGDAAGTAATMNDNLKGKWESFQGTIETLQISIGEKLMPVLSGIVDVAQNLLSGAMSQLPGIFDAMGAGIAYFLNLFSSDEVLGPEEFFTNLPGPVAAAMEAFGGFVQFIQDNLLPIGAGLATMVLTVVVPAFVAWASAAAASAVATITAMAPILVPIAAVAAAVFALKTAWENNFLGIRDAVIPVVDKITTALSVFWTQIQPQLVAAWQNIQVVVTNVWNFLSNLITTGVNTLKSMWQSNWGGIRDIVSGVWNVIKATVTTAWNLIKGIVTTGLAVLKGDWSGAWEGIKGILKTAWEGIQSILSAALPLMITVITQFIPTLVGKITEMAGYFISWVATDVLPKLPGVLNNIWIGITTWVAQVIPKLASAVMSIGGGIIDGIKTGISNAWNGLVDFLSSKVKDALPQFLKDWLGIKSPSTVTAEMGRFLTMGLGEGFKQGEGAMLTDFRGVLGSMTAEILLAFDKTDEGSIRGAWDLGLNGMYAHLANAWAPQVDVQFKTWLGKWRGYIADFAAYVAATFPDVSDRMPPTGTPGGSTPGGGAGTGAGGGGGRADGFVGGDYGGYGPVVYLDGKLVSQGLKGRMVGRAPLPSFRNVARPTT